ncbi:unnamed protein product [Tilletia controversa]|nr:unnamed protein product [Tilletia controversa]
MDICITVDPCPAKIEEHDKRHHNGSFHILVTAALRTLQIEAGLRFLPVAQLDAPLRAVPGLRIVDGFGCGEADCLFAARAADLVWEHQLASHGAEETQVAVKVQGWTVASAFVWQLQDNAESQIASASRARAKTANMLRLEDKAVLMRPPGSIQVPISSFNELDDLKLARDRTREFHADALQGFIEEISQEPHRFQNYDIGPDTAFHINCAISILSALSFGIYLVWRARQLRARIPDALRTEAVVHLGTLGDAFDLNGQARNACHRLDQALGGVPVEEQLPAERTQGPEAVRDLVAAAVEDQRLGEVYAHDLRAVTPSNQRHRLLLNAAHSMWAVRALLVLRVRRQNHGASDRKMQERYSSAAQAPGFLKALDLEIHEHLDDANREGLPL